MPSRRDQIRMSPEEIRHYLSDQSRIILVSNGVDGFPHPVPMNYGIDDSQRVLVSTFRKSQKVKNLRRDPRCSLLVESGETYDELKSVIIYADTEIIEDPHAVLELAGQLRAREEMTTHLSEPMEAQIRASMAKRVVLRFTPIRYVSWDHTKLTGVY